MQPTPAVRDLQTLLAAMDPVLNDGVFVFARLPDNITLPAGAVVASIREAEGLSVIVDARVAENEGLHAGFRCAWITLNVHSDLAAVGLTAAFATALASAGISCNVVAGTIHDHLFVPHAMAQSALAVLRGLQQAASDEVRNSPGA